MHRGLLLLCSCVLLAGCGKSALPLGVPRAPVDRTWLGTFANGSDQGVLVIDVVQTGHELRGQLVFGHEPTEHLYVQGSLLGDSLQLGLDSSHGPYGFTFAVRGRVRADAGLDGHMAFSLTGLAADITCRSLPRLRVSNEASIDVPYAVEAMAFFEDDLWLSTTTSDYVRMSLAGAVRDTVIVYYSVGTRWTSSALTSDGTRLWGFLPGTVGSPSGSYGYSDLLSFNAEGRLADSLRLWHRTGGLAFDGLDFWSLRADEPKLYRVRRFGAVVDSEQLGIPDAVHLEFDGEHFWTLGWSMKRLYQCDFAGRPLAIGDLPGEDTGSLDGGLTLAGSHLWYAETHAGYSTLHRLSVP